MSEYNATYYYNTNEYPAKVILKKDRLRILLEEGGKEVFWYYDQIKKEASTNLFYYPGYPIQSLAVLSASLADELEIHVRQSKKKVVGKKSATFIKLLLAFVAAVMLVFAFGVPWLAARMGDAFPVQYEKRIGETAYASMKNSFVVDEKKTAYINQFFDELHFASSYPVRITVIKSEVANAFALPGGRIVVHDKILSGMHAYEELTALLAHEFSHIENRHTVRSLFRRFAGVIFLSLFLGDMGEVSAILINNAHNLRNLSYSRSLEKEADENGARLLAERRLGCGGFVQLFTMLKKESGGEAVEWLSSHPNLDKRIKNIQDNKFCRETASVHDAVLHALFLKLKTAE